MEKTVHLKNHFLDASVRIPGEIPESQRFDAACVVEQVVLNGIHTFCVPEQLDAKRVTTKGIGLSSEFRDMYAEEAKAGEKFPKLGVGILTQPEEGGRYDMWKHYEVTPFRRSYAVSDTGIDFTEEPGECLGLAVRVLRRVSVQANTLTISTTLENVGRRPYDGSEFQHNFLAIDNLPVGKGYRLTLPYDREIRNIMTRGRRHAKNDGFRLLDESGNPGELTDNPVHVEGQSIVWDGSMDHKTFHKITRADGIRTMAEYQWTLSCDQSPASVSETHHFMPSNFSIWGVEHCVCTEVHCTYHMEPGERVHFARTWTFSDDRT